MENEAILQWWACNPLSLWLQSERANLRVVCSRLGVSMTALGYWRRGLNRPRTRMIVRLARIMKLHPEVLEAMWAVWLAARPVEKELENGYSAPVLATDGRKTPVSGTAR